MFHINSKNLVRLTRISLKIIQENSIIFFSDNVIVTLLFLGNDMQSFMYVIQSKEVNLKLYLVVTLVVFVTHNFTEPRTGLI